MSITPEQHQKALRLLDSAQAALDSAREILGGQAPQRSNHKVQATDAKAYDQGESQIVEGVFDGQQMIGPEEKNYPVPANYASKSKLVEGDRLKLTILPNGSFMYKQISPVDRKHVKGILIQEDGQYKVNVDGEIYRVLLASVTYYKGEAGDEVTLILPTNTDSEWGAIEAIIPQIEGDNSPKNDTF